ncbi:MAG: DUF6308 family protein [Cellulomonadaceae bacterium]|jgi:hypothetical protein|nr:DUF6308 family protein [Cellulomonadaceae bacterium]
MSHVSLPVILEPENSDLAVALLKDYFVPPDGVGSDFKGACFEHIGREWNDMRYVNRVTASDIVAVSCLDVDIPANASIALLGVDTEPVSDLLAQIPVDLDLWNATDDEIGPRSALFALWRYLRRYSGVGQSTTSKIIARKRPRLAPVFDAVIATELGLRDAGGHWQLMRDLLNSGGSAPLHLQLTALGQRAGLNMERITPLRVFDVAVWYFGNPKLTKRVKWVAADHGAVVPVHPTPEDGFAATF